MKLFKRTPLFFLAFLLSFATISPAFAGLTVGNLERANSGSEKKITGTLAFDSSYPTGGETLSLAALGLNRVSAILFEDTGGRIFIYDKANSKVLVYTSAGATPAGTLSSDTAGTPAGTVGAPVFTGTSPLGDLDLATPAFSGTGLTAAGQVITTTSTHTMTLNQCAGMWLLSATGATPPNLILSNTAVTGAAAVLTVQGAASTDAGAYKIVKNIVPVGTNSVPAFTGSALAGHTHTFTGTAGSAAALGQVANTTNLSAVTGVRFVAYGK